MEVMGLLHTFGHFNKSPESITRWSLNFELSQDDHYSCVDNLKLLCLWC